MGENHHGAAPQKAPAPFWQGRPLQEDRKGQDHKRCSQGVPMERVPWPLPEET